MSLLEIKDLTVEFDTVDGAVHAVRGLSYELEAGRTLGIVGESGSGKTVSVLTVMGLLAENARVTAGTVKFDGIDLLKAREAQLRSLRGRRISMVFQDPMTSLDPVQRISKQIGRTIEYHDRSATPAQVRKRVIETLESVGVPDAANRADQYPHQWSGGMRQRAVIAMALVNSPDLIVADEPTTALDATVQAQVLEVFRTIRAEHGCSIILISHDLGVVREIADDVLVMYAGAAAEYCSTADIFGDPRHPYTRALLRAKPGWGPRNERLFTIPGRPPDLLRVPVGCPFEPRCSESDDLPACKTTVPPLLDLEQGHLAACHRSRELAHIEEEVTE